MAKKGKIISDTIVVNIKKISVGKKYYSFDFELWRTGNLVRRDTYSSSHSRSPTYMRKTLKEGYAVELALGFI